MLACKSSRMIARSKMTVFPEPVGALTTRGAFVYRTCQQESNSYFTVFTVFSIIDSNHVLKLHCVPQKRSNFYFLNNSVKNELILIILAH